MKIGIVGATGLVGRTMLQVMEENQIKVDELCLFSSERSAGEKINYSGVTVEVDRLNKYSLRNQFDYLLFAAGKEVATEHAPIAESSGNYVIDNSSAFRRSHPLIIPEINGHQLQDYRGIIANPNCSTIQLAVAINPLHREYKLNKLIISTYQSISGAGNKAIRELIAERENKNNITSTIKTLDLNVIPQIGEIDDDGFCEEENKMRFELSRILQIPELEVAVTTVRVPVIYSHSESVYAEFDHEISLEDVNKIWRKTTGIIYNGINYITPKEVSESDSSFVGRVRKGLNSKSLQFWNVANNIRLGAATNAVNIMKYLMDKN